MNMTVGPHPPAVYWRRRAVVGAPLLLILVLFASCMAGGGSDDDPDRMSAAQGPAPEQSHACTEEDPCVPDPDLSASASASPSAPAFGGAVVPSPLPSPTAAVVVPTPVAASPTSSGECTNKDITVTPVVDKPSYRTGQMPRFKMVITNSSAGRCTMDVGASQQELVVSRSGRRLWSSDDCSPNRGHERRALNPQEKRTYWLTWSGKTSEQGCPNTRMLVGPGTYELVGRLATMRSLPVSFTITAA